MKRKNNKKRENVGNTIIKGRKGIQEEKYTRNMYGKERGHKEKSIERQAKRTRISRETPFSRFYLLYNI